MSKKKRKRTKTQKIWRFFKIQFFLMLLVIAAVTYYYVGGYASKVTQMKQEAISFVNNSTDETFRASQTSLVYDASGELISVLKGEKDVYYLSYEDIPIYVRQATVSIEDKKFYQHHGVDYKAILRAVWAMIRNGEATQGGSTITQQLARNIFLTQEKTWERKVEEIFIAVELEKKYSKEDILEYYLNNVYFGNGYYGIQAASKGYFNKDISQLSLSQIAYLCGIPNSPTYYDPVENPQHTKKRRNKILKNMLEDQLISESSYQEAKAEEITLERPGQIKNNYAETYTYYCATRALMEQAGFQFQTQFENAQDKEAYQDSYEENYREYNKKLYTGGYRIYTSLDLNKERELQASIDDTLAQFTETGEDGVYALQSAAVCIDNTTGMVNAIVGGRGQDLSGYTLNRAYQSYRQPGSAIKPLIVYTPALERNDTADTIVRDEPIADGPSNADGKYAGEITLRRAVELSKNTIAWKIFEELTPSVGIGYLKNMGFARLDANDERQAAALGGFTNGVSQLEMAKGYATIENDGNYREPTCVMKITDAQGNVVYQASQVETIVYKENAARAMTDILEGVITSGTARGLGLDGMPSAGKTGTTNDNKDGWFVGYTRYYTTSVWVGYDQPKELPGLSGASYPGSIWQNYMNKIHQGLTPMEFLDEIKVTDDAPIENSLVTP